MTTRLVQRDFSPKEYCFLWSCIFYTLQRQMGFIKDRAWYSKGFQWQLHFCVLTSVEIYILYFSRKYLYFFFLDYITSWSSSSGSSRNTSEINQFHYSYFKQYLSSKTEIERERGDNAQASRESNKGKHSKKLQMSRQKQSKIFLGKGNSLENFHSLFSKYSASSH